ncbi:hypothetical protein CBL_07122 [Carabus blaptoides fortunei]
MAVDKYGNSYNLVSSGLPELRAVSDLEVASLLPSPTITLRVPSAHSPLPKLQAERRSAMNDTNLAFRLNSQRSKRAHSFIVLKVKHRPVTPPRSSMTFSDVIKKTVLNSIESGHNGFFTVVMAVVLFQCSNL